MDLKEITDLVQIRKYLADTMGNPTQDRATVKEMNFTLLLIDKKIVTLLQSIDFKEYVGYADIKKVVKEAARITNIKSGIK